MSLNRPVRILSGEVARKIAAGEVIDRPNAIVRELMDNAIDSGADSITVEIFNGGIDKIRVLDNGSGMTPDDLKIASKPHATSKISTEQDLMNLSTLGFRGEALSSIAAVSDLTVVSGEYKLEADVTNKNKIMPCQPLAGTSVQSEHLFQNFPARRIFLKRPGTESKMCQTTFIEKALPFFSVEFRLYTDGELKIHFPKENSLKERFLAAGNYTAQKDLFYVLKNTGEGNSWSYSLIIGEPSVYRTDRKEISIYVNNRKIVEYSLMQAIEYGCQGYFPNGTHPVAALFITINPELVDFNIHPAKKEVRFKDISGLHHSVSSGTQKFFRDFTLKSMAAKKSSAPYENAFNFTDFTSGAREKTLSVSDSNRQSAERTPCETTHRAVPQGTVQGGTLPHGTDFSKDFRSVFIQPKNQSYNSSYNTSYAEQLAKLASEHDEFHAEQNAEQEPAPSAAIQQGVSENRVTYYGTALGVFLIAEKNDTLYLIDQHAAHERILYNSIMEGAAKSQKLLIPFSIETQTEQDDFYLESIQKNLLHAGFKIENCGNGKWNILEIHERWTGTEPELQKIILDDKIPPEKIISHIAATTACKAAVKDGWHLDDETAEELAKKALSLEDPHCPHGRPIWTALSREQLFSLVRRT